MHELLFTGNLDRRYVVDEPLPQGAELIDWMLLGRLQHDVLVTPHDDTDPQLLLAYHPPHGFSVMLCDGQPRGDLFACRSLRTSAPQVLGRYPEGGAELWPLELFVESTAAGKALTHLRRTARPDPSLLWIGSNDFGRCAV